MGKIVLDVSSVHRTWRMRLWDAWWHWIGWPLFKRRNEGPWNR